MAEQTQIEKKAPVKIEVLKSILKSNSVQEQFQNALAESSNLFVASIIDLYNGDNRLQECEPSKVVMEALKAAVLKLPINKALGFAWIVAYKGKPTFQIGYKGYIQLAMRTGKYKTINADIVYKGELNVVNRLTGEINLDGKREAEEAIGYFAHFELLNGFSKTLYMTKDQVLAHAKKYSPSFNFKDSAWQTNYNEMAIKTVLRNLLSHYGYLSVEMMEAIGKDEEPETERNENINANGNTKFVNADDISFEEIKPETNQAIKPGF